MRRLSVIAAGFLIAAMIPFLGAASPAVAAGGACKTSSGVTVVVTFGDLGGGTIVRCAHTSGSGVAALHAAGFSTVGTQKDGPSFICRINGKPGLGDEKCGSTPPTNKSWHYYHASNGGSWQFSNSGAGSRNVVQGGFEGWRFGKTAAPTFRPQRAGGSSAGSGANGQGTVEGPSSSENKALPKPKPRTGSSADPTAPTASASPSTDTSSADTAADAPKDSGTNWVPWLALVVVLGLIAAAVITHRRRAQ